MNAILKINDIFINIKNENIDPIIKFIISKNIIIPPTKIIIIIYEKKTKQLIITIKNNIIKLIDIVAKDKLINNIFTHDDYIIVI